MEHGFEALPCEGTEGACVNSWLAISTNAFELFAQRWQADSGTCNGGLKWQYNPSSMGYYYKNSVTNGGFFQTAARLARYTGNQTFADWAGRIWDWSTGVGLVSAGFHVFDGAGDADTANCSEISQDQWSYNAATYLHGAANMYAFSSGDEQTKWETRVLGLLGAANATFFSPEADAIGVMYEQNCEKTATCTTDQTSFKSSLARWLGRTAVLVPSTSQTIMGLLQTSAQAAASGCDGYGNSTCGMKWWANGFDGQSDLGVQLSALEVVLSLLVASAPGVAVPVAA
ncbi:glycoside hydrolase [Pseudomassariella vexata]|uniref:mannan endo-1,6-alpha-mannosidase n=1 Tax=Pseudomassariella vexata TaxID=1141098 RepID=A0A1Y2DQQ0_9PEZI|nr:glycoside hydrolase [Pseudomassariella vexata]ORY61611.1 glycoside hydrolase [Pseudomassariella vexata]